MLRLTSEHLAGFSATLKIGAMGWQVLQVVQTKSSNTRQVASGSCQWMASSLLARKAQPRVQVLMTAYCVVLVTVVNQ